MSLISILNIAVCNASAPFLSKLMFEITFECSREIPEGLQWKLVYFGHAKDETYDQILDEFQMGPLKPGLMQFRLESDYPDASKIPGQQLLKVTAIILTVCFQKKQFFRVGYYVTNHYNDPELAIAPPNPPLLNKISRTILSDKPRITRSQIDWNKLYQDALRNHCNQQHENASTKSIE